MLFCINQVTIGFYMSVDKADIERIANLACLAIDKDDISNYELDLNDILNLVERMSTANTSDIVPMTHPLNGNQRLRADEVIEVDKHEIFQAIAPETEASVYLVPRVIE